MAKLALEETIGYLKDKYEGKLQKPTNVQDIIADNLQMSLSTFNKAVKEEHSNYSEYLINEGIMSLFTFNKGMAVSSEPIASIGPNSYEERIVVPEGTVGLAEGVFKYNYKTKEIVLPNSLKYIGSNVFFNYPGNRCLKNIVFGTGLREIADEAFSNFTAMTSLDLPEGLEIIQGKLFENDKTGNGSRIRSITIPETVKEFRGDMLRNVPKSANIKCPKRIMDVLKSGSTKATDYFVWSDEKDDFVKSNQPSTAIEDMIQKYGIENDDPYADIPFFDDVDDVEIKGRNFVIAGASFDESYNHYDGSYDDDKYTFDFINEVIEGNGGSIKDAINRNTDYLVSDKDKSSHRSLYNSVRYRAEFGKLKIVDYKHFAELAASKYSDESVEEYIDAKKNEMETIISNAYDFYKKCIDKLEQAMSESGDYSEQYVLPESYVKGQKVSSADLLEQSYRFSNRVIEKYLGGEKGREKGRRLHELRDEFMRMFGEMDMLGEYTYYQEVKGYHNPIALAVAYINICSAEGEAKLRFGNTKTGNDKTVTLIIDKNGDVYTC